MHRRLLSPTLLLLALFASLGCTSTAGDGAHEAAETVFRFGLIADVQYADKDTLGQRRYRDSLTSLEGCITDLQGDDLSFVVQCGDLIDGRPELDGSREDLANVLEQFARLTCDVRHVVGNHCLEVPREELLASLELPRSYYSFVHGSWRFVVVDSLSFSVCGLPEGDPERARAAEWLAQHDGPEHPSASQWNGALGEAQREWLRDELADAEAHAQHVVVFSHLPVLAESSTKHHLLWDHEEVLSILDEAPSFAAWINGHDHAGGFAVHDGRSYITVQGMVEADPDINAYAIVEAHPDRLEIQGVGRVPSRTILVETKVRAPQ